MAVLMTLEVSGGTTAQYDRTSELVGIAGEEDAPAGLINHTCGITDEGIVIVDVWESVSSLDEFMHERLGPAFAEAQMPPATPRISPIHELLFGCGSEPNVLVLLDAPGATPETYDAITGRMPSHGGAGEGHPSVLHAAGVEPDGFHIAALYESEEAYKEFAQRELLPQMGNPRYFVLRMWPVHSCLLVRPRAGA